MITGFDAPVFSLPFHWLPFAVLMFVLIFPTTISYMLLPIGLKYLKTTVVAIYGYLILIVATVASLILGQDRFSWTQTFAILFICVGVYLVEVAESKDKSTLWLRRHISSNRGIISIGVVCMQQIYDLHADYAFIVWDHVFII